MQSLPLTIERQQTERNTIKSMAQNNNFPENLITNLKVQMKQQKVHQTQDKGENKKQANFTYYSPNIRKLTNLFKYTNINITFKNTNTIQQYTKPKTLNKNQDYNMRRIYRLTFNTCKMSYIRQTSRILN
jgi:dihydroorotate dehydrogenase